MPKGCSSKGIRHTGDSSFILANLMQSGRGEMWTLLVPGYTKKGLPWALNRQFNEMQSLVLGISMDNFR